MWARLQQEKLPERHILGVHPAERSQSDCRRQQPRCFRGHHIVSPGTKYLTECSSSESMLHQPRALYLMIPERTSLALPTDIFRVLLLNRFALKRTPPAIEGVELEIWSASCMIAVASCSDEGLRNVSGHHS